MTLSWIKFGLSESILDITSNVTSSPTSTIFLSTLSVTIGMSGLLVSGGKKTIGPLPIMSSLR